MIIAAGPAGEAAASLASSRGASVAAVERELAGGACPFWSCVPSKLLHAAAIFDAVEAVADLAETAKGQAAEAEGHVTIVVDRGTRTLLGAFIAGPGVSEAIHEAVLAIRTRTTLDVLADTIHAFPTVARVMGDLFAEAVALLGGT